MHIHSVAPRLIIFMVRPISSAVSVRPQFLQSAILFVHDLHAEQAAGVRRDLIQRQSVIECLYDYARSVPTLVD